MAFMPLSLSTYRADAVEGSGSGKIKIAFIGDSTSDGLWGGVTNLVSRDKCLKHVFELGRFGKNSTGLARVDKYNWIEGARETAEAFKPQLVIVSLGLNDRQSIVSKTANSPRRVTAYNTPEWATRYRDNVMEMLKAASSQGARVLWVGLAAMRDREVQQDASQKNAIFAEAVSASGVSGAAFVPGWRLKPEGDDKFTSYVPDKNGRMINIRASDGEHFTPAGDELVAAYVLEHALKSLRSGGTEVSTSCQLVVSE